LLGCDVSSGIDFHSTGANCVANFARVVQDLASDTIEGETAPQLAVALESLALAPSEALDVTFSNELWAFGWILRLHD
jgi:hypothetical protein